MVPLRSPALKAAQQATLYSHPQPSTQYSIRVTHHPTLYQNTRNGAAYFDSLVAKKEAADAKARKGTGRGVPYTLVQE